MKRGGAKRRVTKGLTAVNRSYIKNLIMKIDKQKYGFSAKSGLTGTEQKLRNKALIAMLYLSARRISELVGRSYPEGSEQPTDVYEGLLFENIKFGKIGDREVLRMRVRILKKGSRKKRCLNCGRLNPGDSVVCSRCRTDLFDVELTGRLKEVWVWKDLRLSDPFMKYILEWLKYFADNEFVGRIFAIGRIRAWQILNQIDKDVWNHWFRHQRLTHLSETMDPYDLKEFAEWESLEPAVSYVHRAPKKALDKIEEADELWK